MRSLNLKLILAFALVILVGTAITYFFARPAVATQYRVYVSRRGQLNAERWAPLVADYYAQTGDWIGVEALLTELLTQTKTPSQQGIGQGRGQGRGQGASVGQSGSVTESDTHVLLADANDRIVFDSEGEMVGQQFPGNNMALGAPVSVEDKRVATLLVITPQSGLSAALTEDFLNALNRGVLLAAASAGLAALLLGALLVRHIIAPLRNLQLAAGAIAGGDLAQRVGVTSRDEVGELSRAFNQMAEALERNERLRRQVVADIAHELRTPLSVIQGQVEALLDGVFPLTLAQLAPIHDQIILLARLVSDLRELALAEAGQLAIQRRRLDLGDLVARVVVAVEPVAAEKNINLTLDASPDLPPISADSDRLSQVLHNLLDNALRHTPPGGEIKVQARYGQADASQVRLVVQDNGEGIPSEHLPHVFDRFYRAAPYRSRSSGSAGLGLAIVRAIVEAHGGRVSTASDGVPGRGSTFTVHLPT
jgi:two-component system OmpR family sensor kinase/two-component system sensor histidine kinase BaeS